MKRLFIIMLAAVIITACGTKRPATLDVAVRGFDDGVVVYLMDYPPTTTLDSTVIEGGRFRFEFADAYPSGRVLMFGAGGKMYDFILEKGAINGTVNPDEGAFFTGTPSNDIWNAVRDGGAELELTSKIVELRPELRALIERGERDTPRFDSIAALHDAAIRAMDEYKAKVVRENPNTVFAAYFLDMLSQSETSLDAADSLLNLVSGAPANAFTDRLRERRDRLAKVAVGRTAPDFTLDRPDDTPFTLSSLRGKLVLIDFWASWCGPCRAENPNVVKLYDRFKDKGFEIVGVSLDESRPEWLRAIEQDGLTWTQVHDTKRFAGDLYQVKFIPHTVLIGPDGVIIAKDLRGEALEAKVAEILK